MMNYKTPRRFQMKKIKFSVGILISLIFLYFTFKDIKWNEVIKILSTGNYFFIIPSILIHISCFYLRSYKWSLILSKFKTISFIKLFDIVSIGFMMNNILPLRAGEFGRIILLSNKYKISKISSGITIFMERLFDISGLLIILLVLTSIKKWPDNINNFIHTSTLIIMIIVLTIPILLNSFHKFSFSKIFRALEKYKFLSFIKINLLKLKQEYLLYKDINLILKNIFYSILLWIIEGTSYYILSKVFNIDINFIDFIFICAISNLSSAIPSSPGYIGTFDLITTSIIVLLGVQKSLALSFVLILHIVLLLPITIIGLIIYFKKKYYNFLSLKFYAN